MVFKISRQQIDQFNEDGFVIARSLFDAAEMAALLVVAKSDQVVLHEAYERRDGSGGES